MIILRNFSVQILEQITVLDLANPENVLHENYTLEIRKIIPLKSIFQKKNYRTFLSDIYKKNRKFIFDQNLLGKKII